VPTHSPTPGAPLSRRALLAGLAGVAGATLVGCTAEGQTSNQKARTHPAQAAASVDPDVTLAAEALASQRQVLDLLEATDQRHHGLSERLAPVIAAHRAHARLLSHAVPKGISASPSPTVDPRLPNGRGVPRSPARALARAAEAEQQLAMVAKRQAFLAESGAFARLLASMAAAAAQYSVVLGSAPSAQGAS
jgi:hypothetical protein